MSTISHETYEILLNKIGYWLISNQKKFNKRTIYEYQGRTADLGTVEKAIFSRGSNQIGDGLTGRYVEAAIVDNSNKDFLPNYVTYNNTKYMKANVINMVERVLRYESNHGNIPLTVGTDIVDLNKLNPSTVNVQKSRSEKILDEFESYFGTCKYIDDALAKIQGRGYSFYFSDGYNMSETIKRMANRQGANCYDSSEVFYHLALGMNTKYGRNYTVQYLHVYCPTSKVDHIRLRLRNGNGNWFYRDPASVLKGGSVTSNWCGTSNNILEVNPSFIMDG